MLHGQSPDQFNLFLSTDIQEESGNSNSVDVFQSGYKLNKLNTGGSIFVLGLAPILFIII